MTESKRPSSQRSDVSTNMSAKNTPTNDLTSDIQQGDGSKSFDRRRFVKGTALALPAIITLRSGAARAVSDPTRCLDDPPLNPNDILTYSDGKPMYFNEQTSEFTPDPNGAKLVTASCYISLMQGQDPVT